MQAAIAVFPAPPSDSFELPEALKERGYLNREQAAWYLGISVRALDEDTKKRFSPVPHFLYKRHPLYRPSELDVWMDDNHRRVRPGELVT